jgi:peptidyl-prolyl cis-trans isomerase D
MKRSHSLIAAAGIALTVTACDGLKEAFTAHVDVVARVGSQELSTERLGAMIGNSTIPIQPEVVKAVADLWVNYQLVGLAAARGDSLTDPKLVDEVMWAQVAQLKARKFFMTVSETFEKADTAGIESRYTQGEMLAAQHILFAAPQTGMSEGRVDSVRKVAEGVMKRATAANFADLVKQYSMDPGSAAQGGSLGVFPAGMMVPEFEAGLRSLQPGQISTSLVRSQFGFHIIRRPLFSEVADEFTKAMAGTADQRAEAKYYEELEAEAKLVVKDNIAEKVKEVAKDPEAALSDKTVLAESRKGNFTAGKLAKWILAFPPQSQIRPQLQQGDDESLKSFVKAMVRNDLLVAKADEAKVKPDSAELADVRSSFRVMVLTTWAGLGVEPSTIGDSARTKEEKERVVAGRIDDFIDNLLKSGGQGFVDVPQPLADALRDKYSARVNTAGIDRATERATLVRAAIDSTRGRGGAGMPGAPMPSAGPNGAGMMPPPGATPPPGGQQ